MTTTMIDVQPCCSKSTSPPPTTVVTYSLPLLMILILLILPVSVASTNCSSIIDSIISNGGGGIGHTRPTTLLSTGSDLRICSAPVGRTCCNRQLETQMLNTSGRELERRVQDRIIVLRHTFESRSSRFDRLFRDMLSNSSRELDSMFTQTYGPFYARHADIFSHLFDNLTAYYTHGKSSIAATLDHFFHTLYRRMYTLMNPLVSIDDEKWLCMRPTMVELAPFGDVPHKMRQQVERSLVAARVFVQAMASARDVVHRLMQLPVADVACLEGVVRMRYCGMCQHVPPIIDVKACGGFCLNVMRACVAPYADIDRDWNAFVDALLNLLDRLKGPYNLENVISPMNVHISEAIMIFQERGQIITSKVSDHCFGGDASTSPIVIRPKRSDTVARSSMSAAPPLASHHSSTSTLEQMARELREKIVAMKGFWRSLPQTLCNDATFATPADDDRRACWNGRTIGKYTKVLVGDGTANQSRNPEVNGTIVDQSIIGIVTDQMLKLRISTNRMKRAYEGRSVDKAEQSLIDDDSPVMMSHQQIPMNDFEMSGSGDDDEHPNGHRQQLNSLTTDDEDLAGGDTSGDGAPPIVAVKGSHRDDELNEQHRQTSNSWSVAPTIRADNDNDVVISEVETRPPTIYVSRGSSIVAAQYFHHLIIIVVVLICFRFV